MESVSWAAAVLIIFFLLVILIKPVLFPPKKKKKEKLNLPPGPSSLRSTLMFFFTKFSELEAFLKDLRTKFGPIITLSIGPSRRPAIFVADHSLAHRLLIHHGSLSSDRPTTPLSRSILNISSSPYGPTWRLLRRNLSSHILHPSTIHSFSWARRWVLRTLIRRLSSSSSSAPPLKVIDHFQHAMFSLLVLMCFGDSSLDDTQISEIARVQRQLLLAFGQGRYNILNLFPWLRKTLLRSRWQELVQFRRDQLQVLIPLIKARIDRHDHKKKEEEEQSNTATREEEEDVQAYVDTLLDLELPVADGEQGMTSRKLTHEDMVSMCGEFLNAGTDTTTTALQWIMANLVKYPLIQEKLYQEIIAVVGRPPSSHDEQQQQGATTTSSVPGILLIKEEELEKMAYLKAVVLEGLRRHPPGHLVLPHKVTQNVELGGYLLPKGATVNFMVAEMGWDSKVWDDPMEFKPERFLAGGAGGGGGILFDLTGNKEIRMMPFGAGRRICPGSALSLLHLEFFIANLVWYFRWTAPDGDDIDLSEKQEFTTVMKYPLHAHISPRA